MFAEDIQGSQAYAKALLEARILTQNEESLIQTGLDKVKMEWIENIFLIQKTDEDIHTANERRLKEIIGPVAAKLHTGRSRNDQVATDMRMWLRSKIIMLESLICKTVKVLTKRAKLEIDILMPGYTHMQRAQPVRWSHWLLSHAWNLKDDVERLSQIHQRTNIMPLGSGALAGNPFMIDRHMLANELAFGDVSYNSMSAVGNRDFIAEFLFWASLTSIHLSRLAEDLILFSSREFAFVRLPDSHTTGSSLMPQKRNPDSLELIRGKAGRIFGHCSGFMMVLKGLPSSYNKDLQEDKEAMFDVYDSLQNVLQVTAGTVDNLMINKANCLVALSSDMLATDIAYYLVRKGIAFREAHHTAGEVVSLAEKRDVDMPDLSLEELKSISNHFEADFVKLWDYESSVEQYRAVGGTSSHNILLQLSKLEDWMKKISF